MPNTADIAAQAGVRPVIDETEFMIRTGAEVRRRNRVGEDIEKGTISTSCEHAAMMLVIESLRATGFEIVEARILAAIEPQAVKETFQQRVQPWMMACFGEEISADCVERGDRLLEEVFELLQSGGYDPARVLPLRDYVWSRDVGEPSQEAGGVQVTLAAYCLAHSLDMHAAGETELERIWTKVEQIRAKQAAKPKHSPLPVATSAAPCGIANPSYRDCNNMKEVGGGFDGERYRCDVCGKGYFLDYEDMK